MRRHGFLAGGLAALLTMPGATESLAQSAAPPLPAPLPAPGGVAPADPAASPPRPRPKPRPKPKPKPPAAQEGAPAALAPPAPKPDDAGRAPPEPGSKPGQAEPAPAPPGTEAPAAAQAAPAADPSLPIVCEPGKAVHYDGPQEFSLWVTRSGTVRVDNPLRPLTPVVTRTLQLVIGDRVATAYGPDLLALRRGGAPAALEATLSGPIQWDSRLGSLPDPLVILGDSGGLLAELRFKECGDAPATKAPPVAKGKKGEKTKGARKAPAAPPLADQAAPPTAPRPSGPPPRRLPQGAIPE